MTFDLDLDLEQTLDAGSSGDHRVQVWWRSSHFSDSVVEEAICAKCLQTDRQTDERRTPHDCISSWNELKIVSESVVGDGCLDIWVRSWTVQVAMSVHRALGLHAFNRRRQLSEASKHHLYRAWPDIPEHDPAGEWLLYNTRNTVIQYMTLDETGIPEGVVRAPVAVIHRVNDVCNASFIRTLSTFKTVLLTLICLP